MNPAVRGRLEQLEAERAERIDRARFRARHAAEQQARISVLLAEVIAVLAEGLGDALGDWDQRPACPVCHRRLAPRRRTCPYCRSAVDAAERAA